MGRKSNKFEYLKKEEVAPEAEQQLTPIRKLPAGKRSDRRFQQVGCYVKKDVYKLVKRKLLELDDGTDFSDVVNGLLEKWVEE